MSKKLLLWDIDRTLVWCGGAGERALVAAAKEHCGTDLDITQINYAGRTDRWIAETILTFFDLPSTANDQEQFQASYIRNLELELPKDFPIALPGAIRILDTITENDSYEQALLTGNLEAGAILKLGYLDLYSYFSFGAFADHSSCRNDLAHLALNLAKQKIDPNISPENIYVIGDTPFDVECGKAIGANVIAVATGKHDEDELTAHEPTVVLSSLEESDRFYRAIGI